MENRFSMPRGREKEKQKKKTEAQHRDKNPWIGKNCVSSNFDYKAIHFAYAVFYFFFFFLFFCLSLEIVTAVCVVVYMRISIRSESQEWLSMQRDISTE